MPFRDPGFRGDTLARRKMIIPDANGDTLMVISSDGLEIFDPSTGDLVAAIGPEAAAQGGEDASLVLHSPTGQTDYLPGRIGVSHLSDAAWTIVASPTDSTLTTGAAVYAVAGSATHPAMVQVGQVGGTDGVAVDMTAATYLAVGQVVHAVTGSVPGLEPVRETWHAVGATDEPAFGSPWANLGGSDLGVMFRRGVQGDVQLAGRAKSTAAVASGSRIFTLPAGYRPATRVVLPTVINSPSVAAVLVVGTDGTVEIANLSAAVTVSSLDLTGLSFPLST